MQIIIICNKLRPSEECFCFWNVYDDYNIHLVWNHSASPTWCTNGGQLVTHESYYKLVLGSISLSWETCADSFPKGLSDTLITPIHVRVYIYTFTYIGWCFTATSNKYTIHAGRCGTRDFVLFDVAFSICAISKNIVPGDGPFLSPIVGGHLYIYIYL